MLLKESGLVVLRLCRAVVVVLACISRGEWASVEECWEVERVVKGVLRAKAAVEGVVEVLQMRYNIDWAVTPMLVLGQEHLDLLVEALVSPGFFLLLRIVAHHIVIARVMYSIGSEGLLPLPLFEEVSQRATITLTHLLEVVSRNIGVV